MADESPAPVAPSAPTATPAAPSDGASTPQPAATATPEKVAVTPEAATAQIESETSFDALAATLDAAVTAEEKAAETPEAEAAPVATTPAPPAAASPEAGAVTPPATPAAAAAEPGSVDETFDDPAGEKLPKNFRFHTTDARRSRFLKLLRSEEGINPIEAARRVGYELPTSATPAPAAAPVATAPAQTIEEVLKPQSDEIAALQAQKKAHRDAYEFDKADEIGEQILDKRLALERRRSELETEANYEQEYNSIYVGAKSEAVKRYPDTAVKGTPQYEAVMRERAHLEQQEPGFFDDPNYPDALIDRLEESRPDLFKKPGAAPAPTPVPAATPAPTPAAVTPPPNAAPTLPARPVGAIVAGSETTTQPLSKQAALDAIDKLNPDELEALSDLAGTQVGGKSAVRRR